MSDVVHKPSRQLADPAELIVGYLDYYRSVITRKVEGVSDAELRSTRVPSGWAPLELLKHLVFMERRWTRWGFAAEQLPDPHGDEDGSGRWQVSADESVAGLLAALHAGGERTREIVAHSRLTDLAAVGGRFAEDEARPSLGWILVYVLQEYARHAGHLDVARELIDGATGE